MRTMIERGFTARWNFSSETLWKLRCLAAGSGTGCISVSIELLNDIDIECASQIKEAGQTVPQQPQGEICPHCNGTGCNKKNADGLCYHCRGSGKLSPVRHNVVINKPLSEFIVRRANLGGAK